MKGIHAAALAAVAALALPAAAHAAPPPLDPQNWSWQDNLTWNDYHPLPGPDYSDPSIQPSVKKWKVALVLTDFPDKTFTLSKPVNGTIFGTPTDEAHDIPRDQVPAFLQNFLNTPSALNHNQTMNRYWMEDSHGKYGVQLDAYGPYPLPGRSYQYFMQDFSAAQNRAAHCPDAANFPCTRDFRTDSKAAWTAALGATANDVIGSYDNVFYISAGEDESSTWQEFGQMKWLTPDDVPDAFGPKQLYGDQTQTNWAITRYVPWSSWASVSTIWPNAVTSGPKPLSSIEGESSGLGTYTHELTHNLGILDNYSNPYSTPYQRGFTGMWDMMSRGSFNGPGGPHTRFLVPATQGGSLGSQHDMRNKLKLGFITPDQVLRLNRSGLTKDGIAVADVTAREVDPGAGLSGIQVALDGGDKEAACSYRTDWTCDGGGYDFYTAEVVQQLGSDSFDPGHGVLLMKTKTSENRSCGSANCFAWVVDSHPTGINHVDFVGPDGKPVMATLGDERQLNDASFNAGTDSGSSYEYEDTANRLHFYILNLHKDGQGVLHYQIAVQSLDGAGPEGRGVALSDSPGISSDYPGYSSCTFTLKNTGTAATINPADNPSANAAAFMGSDVYRLSASASGSGWTATLRDALATAPDGGTTSVPVFIDRAADAAKNGAVTLTATSVSDPSKSATAQCGVSTGDVGGSVPATLSLTMGTPASFGSFTPGIAKQYTATTNATVISTAGDATLTVADTSTTAPGHLVNGSFSLPQPLQAAGQNLPATLKTYSAPASNDAVPITFSQNISETDPLRTGTYAKTLTFTLSTTNP